eukprot:gene10686-12377_t
MAADMVSLMEDMQNGPSAASAVEYAPVSKAISGLKVKSRDLRKDCEAASKYAPVSKTISGLKVKSRDLRKDCETASKTVSRVGEIMDSVERRLRCRVADFFSTHARDSHLPHMGGPLH